MSGGAVTLTGQAAAARDHRGSHMQIIACAGAGKTETVSQRIASLINEGVEPRSIVAFTFTERAASELKHRIALRVRDIAGAGWEDKLTGLFVGTIHAYCFRLLQQQVPRYETYEVLDDNRLTAFLAREGRSLGIHDLADGWLYDGIDKFLSAVAIVENELIPHKKLPDDFREMYEAYLRVLEELRVLSYGQQIVGAVRELEKKALRDSVHSQLRHLIVDEYQDVNPAQERLIELLVGPETQLCVVGDDDQAIYQWRGSDVKNILEFDQRWPKVAKFVLDSNYRSHAPIVTEANEFAKTIKPRLNKTMKHVRTGTGPRVIAWSADKEEDEAGYIADHILELNQKHGVPYSDIAVLARTSTSFPRLVTAFSSVGIPVRPAGRTGLFTQPESVALSRAFLWLTTDYRKVKHGNGERFTDKMVFDDLNRVFGLSSKQAKAVRKSLESLKDNIDNKKRQANLVSEYYELLELLGVKDWDFNDTLTISRLGTLARFGSVLEDYESVTRRARPDPNAQGTQRGGSDRGKWFYKNLADYINRHGADNYTDFGGEENAVLDAIDLTTIHQAKGLEWPVVFVPSLTKRFAPKDADPPNELLGGKIYDHKRYASNDADERRVFYVAITRGREWVSASKHDRVNVKATSASPYFTHLVAKRKLLVDKDKVKYPQIDRGNAADDTLKLSYSDIAAYLECSLQFRLRTRVGFPTMIAAEIGYGKAVHHVLRTVADVTREKGQVPSEKQIDKLLDESFFLPVAGAKVHQELKKAARNLITTYVKQNEADLFRTWESERPFELRLADATVSGRADVILDYEGGKPGNLALLDYKSSTRADMSAQILQLQVYALAGKREGLNVEAAYVHDLKAATRPDSKPRHSVSISAEDLTKAEQTVNIVVGKIKRQEYSAKPGDHCKMCDVRRICKSAK